jgi:ABC-type multidrug transport system ATPase subunit
MLFLLANKEKQETLFNSLAKEYPCTLDMCSHEVINGEVTASSFTRFACRLKGVNGDRVANYLERLKFKETARLKLARYPEEERKKLICAIVFAAENAEAIVINDFLKGVSHEFERTFLEMAAEEAASGRRLIYVSSRMYAPASSLIKQDVIVEEHQPFQLELQKISLR